MRFLDRLDDFVRFFDPAVRQVKARHQLADEKHANILNPVFLLEEFHRVYYGLLPDEETHYISQPRSGRGGGPWLHPGSTRRKLIWECFEIYLPGLASAGSFTSKRLAYLQQLRAGEHAIRYDYLFVDEFQDCTPADFEIFQHLLHNPNHLVLAGDLAQSVQIGRASTGSIPRPEGMMPRRVHRLFGSYRLPFRISEAIKDISEHISTLYDGHPSAGVISPWKGSPPGARPIVVYAKNTAQLADKVSEIIRAYRCFDLKDVTIMERDTPLMLAIKERLNGEFLPETETILKLKGLEKTCVVWSTRATIEHRGEVFEFIYTILTRTSCLLLITITPDTREMYFPILKRLRADRLIFWDAASKQRFAEIQKQEEVLVNQPDETDD